ncbi:FGGY family carbohydrate kinase [Microbacterium sp.]|uniref:xylulokinase n=1 Tax=Microbacterium sp. TaxID=51671 RepID=UPI0025DF3643|nr:FGGY family carbohydrate kinase [Microbacterium sp.]
MPSRELALALDLGTGGCKASLWSHGGECVAETSVSYPTMHPGPGLSEQRTSDWWDAVVTSTRRLLQLHPPGVGAISGIALSGQSLGLVQLDARAQVIVDSTPIWSDTRGDGFTAGVFDSIEEGDWYARTGNGFPAGLYPIFKTAWLRSHRPEEWAATRHVVGSKDFINLALTGVIATDHSYASGSGAYNLFTGSYDAEILAAAGVPEGLLPEPRESTDVLGALTSDAARILGLAAGIPVLAGGVDNACMALGSRGTADGRVYAALGSSSWITVTTAQPIIDPATRPYVFRSAIPGLHVSALSTFSSGTSLEWLRDIVAEDQPTAQFITSGLNEPIGARGALFLPMLSGGTPLEGGPQARGALMGLELGQSSASLARAALEGIALALRRSFVELRKLGHFSGDLLISGGGARHDGWNQLYSDVLGTPIVRTAVDHQAATLGAAAITFVGLGLWPDFSRADDPHDVIARFVPEAARQRDYDVVRQRFDAAMSFNNPQ